MFVKTVYEAAIFMIKEVGSKKDKISGLVSTDTSEKTIVSCFFLQNKNRREQTCEISTKERKEFIALIEEKKYWMVIT